MAASESDKSRVLGIGLPVVVDEETRLLLLGNAEEVNRGLTLIQDKYRNPLTAWVRKRFPGLSSADLADTWAETLGAVFKAVQKEDYDPDAPLLPWLQVIARNRATDYLRRQTFRRGGKRIPRKVTDDEVLKAVANELKDTRTGERWGLLQDLERQEILALVRSEIVRLPFKQRLTIQAFTDGYPNTTDMQVLREYVTATTGAEETVAGVKRALQEARAKLRASFGRKGLL